MNKTTAFVEIKELGQRWMAGDCKAVLNDIMMLRKPKSHLYPAAVHRYIVKEQGFPEGSKFISAILNEVTR
jgi:hypothetical protein